jgi:asparagine N-glycosylation enzyme membrane subunit Stt3
MTQQDVDVIIELIMPFLGIGLPFFALYIIFYAIKKENKQKMAMIEKGMNPLIPERKKENKSKPSQLKNGIILIGLAFGILMGYMLRENGNMEAWVAYPSMILVFGGAALIVAYFIERKKNLSVNQ